MLDELSPSFFESLMELKNDGYQLVFVHGGGPDINQQLEMHQIPRNFENGLRKTSAEALEIVEMVLAGKSNRKLTRKLDSYGFRAFGVNGSDGAFLHGDFIDKEHLGYVGHITEVNTDVLAMLLRENYTPVITPIAITNDGVKLNVNADFAAAAIAHALSVEHFLFVTDVKGIVIDEELIVQLDKEEIEGYISTEKITGGMVPKVKSCIAAIEKGLQSVRIVSGKEPFFVSGEWIGTEIN